MRISDWSSDVCSSDLLLEKVAADEAILVSTGANDWLESNGRMERVEGGFKVTATKPFASGAPGGDLLVTSAAYDDPREGAQVLHFPVPLKDRKSTRLNSSH